MKVRELIEALSKFDSELPVTVECSDGLYGVEGLDQDETFYIVNNPRDNLRDRNYRDRKSRLRQRADLLTHRPDRHNPAMVEREDDQSDARIHASLVIEFREVTREGRSLDAQLRGEIRTRARIRA